MKRFSFILLLLITLVGFALRFYQLGEVPVGFHRDEAFLGYNGYSLLLTGRDMSGNFLPIHLSSFLYSPAAYSYASIPFIWLFGLNEFSVRFASAFFGTGTIVLVYFLVKELFGSKEIKQQILLFLALISSLFFAISPWHINLSRVATENVLVVFFITLGVLLQLKWANKKSFWLLLGSFLAFGVTLTLYQAPRAFLPLFIPVLFLFFHPKPFKKNIILPGIMFFLIIIVPIITILFSHELTQRMRMLSVFQNAATQLVLDEQIREDEGNNVTLTRFFHNKASNYSITFFSNYFNHFSYNFLFLDSAVPDRYRVPQMGLLYFFELPLLLLGIWKLLVNHKKQAAFLFLWILLAPVGSALTYDDVPNLQRTLIMFPAISIISAYGFVALWGCLKRFRFGRLLFIPIVMIMLYGFLYYLHQYYVHQINHRPWYRQEGYKELVAQLATTHNSYKKVVITDAESAPSIFFMFYNKYDPRVVQKELLTHPTNAPGRMSFENYEFPEKPCPLSITSEIDPMTNMPILSGEKDNLYVNSVNCRQFDDQVEVFTEIKRSDGTIVFRLYKL